MNNENAATEQLTNINGVGMPVVASCNSLNDDMGIDWDDASGNEEDLGLLFWDELTNNSGGILGMGNLGNVPGGTASNNNTRTSSPSALEYNIMNNNPPTNNSEAGFPLEDVLQQQQQVQAHVVKQDVYDCLSRTTTKSISSSPMVNLINDTIIEGGQSQWGLLGNMSSLNSIPPLTTPAGMTYAGMSDFSNSSAPSSVDGNKGGGEQEQMMGQATAALSAGESSVKLIKNANGGRHMLGNDQNILTVSTLTAAENTTNGSEILSAFGSMATTSQSSIASLKNDCTKSSNALWPPQQKQQQLIQQAAQMQQLAATHTVLPQHAQTNSMQVHQLMNAVAANSQAVPPSAYLLWLMQQHAALQFQAQTQAQGAAVQVQQNVAAPPPTNNNNNVAVATTTMAAQPIALSQLMLQFQAQQQQSGLVQASKALAAHQNQLQQATSQLQQQQRQVQTAQVSARTRSGQITTASICGSSSPMQGKKRKLPPTIHNTSLRPTLPTGITTTPTAIDGTVDRGGLQGGNGAMFMQERPITATPYTPNNASAIIPNAALSASVVIAANNFPIVSASDTEGTLIADPSKRVKRGSCVLSSAGEGSADDEHLTEEEQRRKHNRERNREHAKNTRLRKKAYVERLKMSVDELCRERDTLVSERATSANLLVEIHSKRVDVLRSFFALRASYSSGQKRELWSSILDESSFTCRIPVTPYQSFPSSEVQVSNCQRTIVGVDAMIGDAAANYVFLDSIVDRSQYPNGKIKFQYTLVTEESVVSGNQLMARWAMSTLNAKKCGANTELHQRGMLICKFNSAHKIVNLELMFDVMAFMLQVKMAMGFNNFNDVVIPNTVQTCGQKVYDYPMVLTLANRPYTIVQVNERWENLTGFKGQEVVGKRSCSILQSPGGSSSIDPSALTKEKNRKEMNQLMGPVLFQRPSCSMVTNYTKTGRRYKQYVTIYPLSTDSNVTHYFGSTTFVQWLDDQSEGQGQTIDPSSESAKIKGSQDSSSSALSIPGTNSLSSTATVIVIPSKLLSQGSSLSNSNSSSDDGFRNMKKHTGTELL